MRVVALTGLTGFLGPAVLAKGLETDFADRWICLVRADDAAAARKRAIDSLALFVGEAAAVAAQAKIDIVVGGLNTPGVLDAPIFRSVTEFVHLAADTSYRSRANNHLVNVEGTRAVALAARRMPHLRRMIYAGTAMICGRNAPLLVHEDDSPNPAAEHVVYYTKTKAEAETMLRSEFADLPVVVVRPSIVAGHSVLGAEPSASIFWMFRAGDKLRMVSGDPSGSIDVVPVDWTARTILQMLDRPSLKHATYHLSAGLAKRTKWVDLAAAFEACEPSGAPHVYEQIGAHEWRRLRARFEAVFGLGRPVEIAMLRAMRAYYEFCALGITFANDRLIGEGFALPPSLPEYLPVCLAKPAGLPIIQQFADDLGMFLPALGEIGQKALQTIER